MTILGSTQPEPDEKSWQYQLDRFVDNNQQELAALAWGFYQEQTEHENTLGIDIIPTPHFISCSREALEKLNNSVNHKLQEILGLIDGYQPEQEVLMIGFANNGVKLIYFEPELNPPECFEKSGQNIASLLEKLEAKMLAQIQV
ncbi:MAG: hypothetical protein WAN66_16675 [Limnoraphis robusta]|uniref:Chaperone protein CcmS domain-containing protein n=1 Tax=Limnoraphis robusta CS-951 TaxID=1637645 RepID=A0A0F5YEW7_9CYAN|nr:hypothetical protein [Limnoraphis robusta]KKD37167.1 hypothetical protein WN50_15815 [Limnoraphis robusta CS-951]